MKTRSAQLAKITQRLVILLALALFLADCQTPVAQFTATPAEVQEQAAPSSAPVTTAAPALPTPSSDTPEPASPTPGEQAVQLLKLSGPLADAKAEVSGLAWYQDHLIFLPQFPERMSRQADGALFALPRQQVLDAVKNRSAEALAPVEIPFYSDGIDRQIEGFEGFEAIGFAGDQIYLTIEAGGSQMKGYLVMGTIAPDLSEVRLDSATLVENPPQINLDNKSDEALVLLGGEVLTLYEANGASLNPNPHATRFDHQLQRLGEIPFPPLEYRVTDATPPDANGLFWVINYFFPGEPELMPEKDPLAEQFGQGPTHSNLLVVERLVELQYTPEGIQLSGQAPIQLELISNTQARNWEGLAQLETLGFLIITDKFPETLFGFVPFP
jgi:hypothetical protein